jgi:hypothetical protein
MAFRRGTSTGRPSFSSVGLPNNLNQNILLLYNADQEHLELLLNSQAKVQFGWQDGGLHRGGTK